MKFSCGNLDRHIKTVTYTKWKEYPIHSQKLKHDVVLVVYGLELSNIAT